MLSFGSLPPKAHQKGLRAACLAVVFLGARITSTSTAVDQSEPDIGLQHRSIPRKIPAPLREHPGNVFLQGETVKVPLPPTLLTRPTEWRLLNDRHEVLRKLDQLSQPLDSREPLDLGKLEAGWYRLEFGADDKPETSWTTLAVLPRLGAPVPLDSPIAVDSAAAWFARDDMAKQAQLANLAALAGVNWVRDRLRWCDIQPNPGELKLARTTYDTSAKVHKEAGLQVLQVFHDTPPWASESPDATGRFAPDLRRVYELCRALAVRFKGTVAAWEPWNEANIATFGGHTVDQMCSWQKAAWLGFKAGDPAVVVGWNVTAAVPTPAHTKGVLANETWPYFDTYNIHSYDWSHAYSELWEPAREAASGRPLWITEADRGTPHLKNPPWFDQEPRLERLKAEWIAQAYASSLFSGASQHYHFILGNYQEPNGIQFGLLRFDLTPRPAYVALAAVGRCLAGARALGRWLPGHHVQVYAFRARPDGQERDVLVAWSEKEVDWNERGSTTANWALPAGVEVEKVIDYLGRPCAGKFLTPLTSAPVFIMLAPGQSAKLPLESAAAQSPWRSGNASQVVLQLSLPRSAACRVEDLKWSEGFAYEAKAGEALTFKLHAYNFATNTSVGRLQIASQPERWETTLDTTSFSVAAMERAELTGSLRIPSDAKYQDGWVVLTADCGQAGRPALAFRVLARH
jgi:hypothetical protein